MNNTLLTLLAIDKLTENNEKQKQKESAILPAIFLILIGFGLVYLILNKLGVPSEQLQYAVFVMAVPFLWDYILGMDLSNFQHILVAVGTMVALFFGLCLLEATLRAVGNFGKSKFTAVQSFGYVLHIVLVAIRGLLFAVLIVSFVKFSIHTFLEIIFWLF